MLYQVLTRTIARGTLEGLQDKLDIYFLANRLTSEQYTELTGQLTAAIEGSGQ